MTFCQVLEIQCNCVSALKKSFLKVFDNDGMVVGYFILSLNILSNLDCKFTFNYLENCSRNNSTIFVQLISEFHRTIFLVLSPTRSLAARLDSKGSYHGEHGMVVFF